MHLKVVISNYYHIKNSLEFDSLEIEESVFKLAFLFSGFCFLPCLLTIEQAIFLLFG